MTQTRSGLPLKCPWDDVKAGSKKAYNELADGFQKARQWVGDKIAP